MSERKTYLPRDCYTGADMRRLFGVSTGGGKLRLKTRAWLAWARAQGKFPFVVFGDKTILYPRELIDAIIKKANETVCTDTTN